MIQGLSIILLVMFSVAVVLMARKGLRGLRVMPGPVRTLAFMWLLLAIGTGVYFERIGTVHQTGGLDASAKMQIILFLIAGLMATVEALRFGDLGMIARIPIMMLLVYGLLGLISTVYSPSAFVTLYKAALIILDVVAIIATVSVVKKYGRQSLVFDVAFMVAIIFTVGAFIGVLIRPDQAVRVLGGGGMFGFVLDGAFPYMNGNELGFLSSVVALVSISKIFGGTGRDNRVFWGGCLLIGLSGVLFAQARTSMVGLVAGLVIISIGMPKLRKFAYLGVFLSVLFSLFLMISELDVGMGEAVEQYLSKGQGEQGLQTMHGRFHAWTTIGASMIMDSPILGHGYEAGVRYAGVKYGIEATHMHNSHVQILVNSGMVGYIPWFFMVAWGFIKFTSVVRSSQMHLLNQQAYVIYAVLVMMLLRTMTGSVMVNHGLTLIFLIGAVVYLLANGARVEESPNTPKEDNVLKVPGSVVLKKRNEGVFN